MISFDDLTHQLNLIDDLIISEMIPEDEKDNEQKLNFSKHLVSTKYWFVRISNANKKRYIFALVSNITNVWVLSLILKAIWNSRPKDAIMSVTEQIPYSSYDVAPTDNNRTASSLETLSHVMKNERKWFVALSPEFQTMVICELLTLAGGPVMWSLYTKVKKMYNQHQLYLINNIENYVPVIEDVKELPSPLQSAKEKSLGSLKAGKNITDSQQLLQANLLKWDQTMKALRDSLKIEEKEIIFKNGETKKVWEVNRTRPEFTETVDFFQLLPGAVGKKILSYLPNSCLSECAKVNRYWAFLITDLKDELAARRRINDDIAKLQANVLLHDEDWDTSGTSTIDTLVQSLIVPKFVLKTVTTQSLNQSDFTGASFKHFFKRYSESTSHAAKPLHNLREMTNRLDTRGAADDQLWSWCETTMRRNRKSATFFNKGNFDDIHFPCPLLRMNLKIPLKTPLHKDPSYHVKRHSSRIKHVISNSTIVSVPPPKTKKFKLWTKDLSPLYPVSKIPSYFCYYK